MKQTFKTAELGKKDSTTENRINHKSNKEVHHEILILRTDEPYGIGNSKLRTLCIAAYLRCLKAFLGKPLSNNDAIAKIRHHLTKIALLCSTTNWFDGNIGYKFISIVG